MNYLTIYVDLIVRAQFRELRGEAPLECEKHHVWPKCFGGIQLVKLTYREHFIAHRLLYKLADTVEDRNKMSEALRWLCKSNKGTRIISSRQFEVARRYRSQASSDYFSEIIGPNGETRAQLIHRARAPGMADQEIFEWYHPIHNEEYLSCYQLSLKYPNLKGRSTNLLKVAHEERKSCNGWVLLKYKDRDFKKECREKMSRSAKNRTDKRKNQHSKLNNARRYEKS